MEKGRVIAEFRDRYEVSIPPRTYLAEILGHLRFAAESRADLPAVGDWVDIESFDQQHAIIHSIHPRKNLLERHEVGSFADRQIIAANIDCALIVQGLDRDFNINRIERYLTLCHAHSIEPLIILNKSDLLSEAELREVLDQLAARVDDVPVLINSNLSGDGLEAIKKQLKAGDTYCVLGSSGVGKSTLINHLLGRQALETSAISSSTNKGKHTTTHRELFTLPNGSYIIDNPGMREVGLTDSDTGIEETFEKIVELARDCHFSDCTHTVEEGCKVLEAIDQGDISQEYLDNYHRLNREQEHFASSVAEKRRKDKAFGKMIKNIKKRKFK